MINATHLKRKKNMKNTLYIFTLMLSFVLSSCGDINSSKVDNGGKITALNKELIEAAITKDFSKIAHLYTEEALLLAEYNPLIDGKAEIEKFYQETFERQDIESYQKNTLELFDLGNSILEIGNFAKKLANLQNQEGKYFNVWESSKNGELKLKSEAFGYYHAIENPAELRVHLLHSDTQVTRNGKIIPLELQAYEARNKNIVRDRDSENAAMSYTEDGIYYPFADTPKVGMENLSKHYHDYHSYPVSIDSIEVWTYDYEIVKGGILKFNKFYVDWSTPESSGKSQGTGIIYYQRQKDNSLKIHRQIGLHIYDE